MCTLAGNIPTLSKEYLDPANAAKRKDMIDEIMISFKDYR